MIYSFKFLIFHIGLFVLAYLGYEFLINLRVSKNKKLKKFFHIPSAKSISGAILLGGLVSSIVVMAGVSILLIQFRFSDSERILTIAWLTANILLTLSGYLDDKFELRASIKLMGQLLAVFVFSILTSLTMESMTAVIYIPVLIFWGVGTINGANLLDGIDTITIKLSLTTYATFFTMGLWFDIHTLPVLSIIFSIPMMAFYFFNREPSRIHLGEIGGTIIGLSYLFLAAITFNGMHAEKNFYDLPTALALSLMPLHLPMVEVGVSFLRRLYKGKSPFIGDRHHVHYILRDFYKLGATKTATLYSAGHFCVCAVMFLLSAFSPYLAFILGFVIYILGFLSIGKEFWERKKGQSGVPFSEMFKFIRKKEINVIDTSKVDSFKIEIIKDEDKE